MAKRRPLHGQPLLVASVGAAMAMTLGCSGGKTPEVEVVGNLVAPPMVEGEVCIDVTPPEAAVTLDGQATTERCTTLESYGGVTVEASAPGYTTHTEVVQLSEKVELEVALQPEVAPPPPMPVGNLMPPQPSPVLEPETPPQPEPTPPG